MADHFYLPNRPPQPPRQPKSGERLFEFPRGHDRILCELYELGNYGIDVRSSKNEEFWYSRRFDPRLDSTRTPRDLAIQWAEVERMALESRTDAYPFPLSRPGSVARE